MTSPLGRLQFERLQDFCNVRSKHEDAVVQLLNWTPTRRLKSSCIPWASIPNKSLAESLLSELRGNLKKLNAEIDKLLQ